MAVIGNAPFQGLVSGGEILDASIEGVDLSTSAIAARLGYTPVNPGAAAITAGSINNTTIGATTVSTGAFTTLASNAAVTFTAGTASTTTGTGTLVITGGLGVSGRINAANFDGIVGANTAAAGSFTTLSATGTITQTGSSGTLAFNQNQGITGAIVNKKTATAANSLGAYDEFATKDNTGTTNTWASGVNINSANSSWELYNGGTRFLVTQAGNVGIGTSSPTRKLDVATAGTSYIRASNTTNSVNVDLYATTARGGIGTQSNHVFDFFTNNAIVGTFDTNGNLGVGVTAPLNRLDARAASAIIANYQTIQASSTDSAAIDLGGGIGLGGYYSGTAAYAVFGNIVGRKENATGGNYAGYLAFGTNAQATGILERVRITSTGVLAVNYPGGVLADGNFVVAGSNGTGQGTADTVAQASFIETTSGNYAGVWIGTMTNQNTGVIGTRTATGNLAFQTYNAGWAERMRLTYDGNLLVGATSATTNATQTAKVVGGNFRSLSSIVQVPGSSTVTLLTLSSTVNGVYIISGNLGAQGNQIYGGMLIVVANTGSFRIVTNGSGSSCSLTLSGANVQITNPVGSALDGFGSAILVAN